MVMPEGFHRSQLYVAEHLSGAIRDMTVAECNLKRLVKLFELVAVQSVWTERELRDILYIERVDDPGN
jgi:hypothetical protein